MDEANRSKHIDELAAELLDDIELSRLNAEALLLKATRLARLVGASEITKWLRFELRGYNSTDKTSLKYMSATRRFTDKSKGEGYWIPLPQIEAILEADKARLSAMSTQGIGGETAVGAVRVVTQSASAITTEVGKLSRIKSCTLSLLHEFVSSLFYERKFSHLSQTIFERYTEAVDARLTIINREALERISSVYDRLSENSPEAVSQALTTCRRIIDGFADSVYPPSAEPAELDGEKVSLGKMQHQNRINAFIAEIVDSKSRKKRLRQNLSNLYERVCAGIHDAISPEEARALLLNTYLLLGEIASLPEQSV